jgi:mannosyl-oligosaccharide alpha-1,2-mannosidase
MGDDEYHPLSHRGSNLGSGGGIGYPVFDALDTMLLMGPALDAEYKRAHM